jgi:hypothetical protein
VVHGATLIAPCTPFSYEQPNSSHDESSCHSVERRVSQHQRVGQRARFRIAIQSQPRMELLRNPHYAQNPSGWGSECNGLTSSTDDGT